MDEENVSVRLSANSDLFRTDLEQLGAVFFPGMDLEVTAPGAGGCLHLQAQPAEPAARPSRFDLTVTAVTPDGRRLTESGRVACDPAASPRAYEHQLRRPARALLLEVLARWTGFRPGWGTLTGVRPTRLLHDLLDQGLELDAARQRLLADYRLLPAKADLLTEIAALQRPYLRRDPRAVSIYVGVPYCPTICSFCSFSAYAIRDYRSQVPDFLAALRHEMTVVGEAIRELGLRVETIYFGGGTPTSPGDEAFADLLAHTAHTLLRDQRPVEYTVEAGRPETISAAKLDAMAAFGVHRISVNPQTTVQETLSHLGRIHTVAAFHMAYERVRAHRHPFVVNSDIIVGLPGEGAEEVRQTLNDMRRLAPDNLTVHTLAIKRGSRLHYEGEGPAALSRLEPAAAEQMIAEAAAAARAMGQRPYYLYRQKYQVGSMENVGYSLPGKESIYNIQIMEERQTVIGLGAGATSKWFHPRGWLLQAPDNPKEPGAYMLRAGELAREKVRQLHLIYGERAPVPAGAE